MIPAANLDGFNLNSVIAFANALSNWARRASTAGGISNAANPPIVTVRDTVSVVLLAADTLDVSNQNNLNAIQNVAMILLCGTSAQSCNMAMGTVTPPASSGGSGGTASSRRPARTRRGLQSSASPSQAQIEFTAERQRDAATAGSASGDEQAAVEGATTGGALEGDISFGSSSVEALSASVAVRTSAAWSGASGDGVDADAVAAALADTASLDEEFAAIDPAAGAARDKEGYITAATPAVQYPRMPPLPSPPPSPYPSFPTRVGDEADGSSESLTGSSDGDDGGTAALVAILIVAVVLLAILLLCAYNTALRNKTKAALGIKGRVALVKSPAPSAAATGKPPSRRMVDSSSQTPPSSPDRGGVDVYDIDVEHAGNAPVYDVNIETHAPSNGGAGTSGGGLARCGGVSYDER